MNARRLVVSQAAASDAASDSLAPAAQALEDQEEACFRVRANPLVGTVAYLPDLPTLRAVARATARPGGAESQWADLPDGAAALRHPDRSMRSSSLRRRRTASTACRQATGARRLSRETGSCAA